VKKRQIKHQRFTAVDLFKKTKKIEMTPKRIFGLLVILSVALEQSSSFKIQSQSKSKLAKSTKGSFLRKIGTNPPSYLFGSAHVPTKRFGTQFQKTPKELSSLQNESSSNWT
jgi:hypothetical protein